MDMSISGCSWGASVGLIPAGLFALASLAILAFATHLFRSKPLPARVLGVIVAVIALVMYVAVTRVVLQRGVAVPFVAFGSSLSTIPSFAFVLPWYLLTWFLAVRRTNGSTQGTTERGGPGCA
jgi:hypothetical protein